MYDGFIFLENIMRLIALSVACITSWLFINVSSLFGWNATLAEICCHSLLIELKRLPIFILFYCTAEFTVSDASWSSFFVAKSGDNTRRGHRVTHLPPKVAKFILIQYYVRSTNLDLPSLSQSPASMCPHFPTCFCPPAASLTFPALLTLRYTGNSVCNLNFGRYSTRVHRHLY